MENLKKLKVGKYRCLNSWDQEFTKVIKKILSEAEYVYAYKTFNQGFDEIELMKWIKATSLTNFKKVEIEFTEENQIEEIKSIVSEDYVYVVELNETTRNKFIELFKISVGGISGALGFSRQHFLDDMYIDDGMYDHYDFVFTIGNKVLLKTAIHPFSFTASEELYCKVQEEEHHTIHNVKCEGCGNDLTRNIFEDKGYFKCYYGNQNIDCFNSKIAINNVEEAILQTIKTHVKLVTEKKTEFIDNKEIEKEISKLEKNLKQINLQIAPLYEQFKLKIASEFKQANKQFKLKIPPLPPSYEELKKMKFLVIKERPETEELSDKMQVIQIQLEHFKERVNKQIQSKDIISSSKNLSFDKLTRELYDQFVSEVIVDREGKVEIKMKDEDPFANK